MQEMCKDFYGNKKNQYGFTFLYAVSYKSHSSQIWQPVCKLISIRLIWWLYERGRSIHKIYAIKTNHFDSYIMGVRGFFLKRKLAIVLLFSAERQ